MWLSDLGATVVKVERAESGDETRQWGPPFVGNASAYFAAANRSKLSLALDLDKPEDVDIARRLAAKADVMVENFLTGALARFRLDYDSVAAINPRVVYTSITGFGSGAGAKLPGYDFVVQAVGGLMSVTGEAEGEASKAGVALVDILTAKDAVIGTLAALRERDRLGSGQHVEVNLLSSLLGSLANQAGSYLATGVSPGRMGNQHPSIAPYETLRCRTGLLAVACGNDRQFSKLTTLLGSPELAGEPRFATNADRVMNRPELVRSLERLLALRDADEWEVLCSAAGVPAGQVGTVASGFARADELGLSPTVTMPAPHPAQVAHPIRYSSTRVRRPVPCPELGADTEAVQEWLISGNPIEKLDELLAREEPNA
jgi:crotonobetainyl-CoA:carnitine CoA-transferase CaiB-like acyl-CoA transferase